MLIPELKIGDYVKVDCTLFTDVEGSVRTGEVSRLNEDSTYDIKIGKFLYPSCDAANIIQYRFVLEPLVIGMNVELSGKNLRGKLIGESEYSLCFDVQIDQTIQKDVHYDFFHGIYQTFAIGEKVWYKLEDLNGTIVEQFDDLWYGMKLEDENLIKVPEFKLSKRSDYTKSALFRWLKS